jgi:hypothetical protein
MAGRMNGYVTVQEILDAHAQFGRLDRELARKAMGPNWPHEWNSLEGGIFEPQPLDLRVEAKLLKVVEKHKARLARP